MPINQKNFNPAAWLVFAIFIVFIISPFLAVILIIALILFLKKNPRRPAPYLAGYLLNRAGRPNGRTDTRPAVDSADFQALTGKNMPSLIKADWPKFLTGGQKQLEKRKKYLQIALNSSLEQAEEIISLLPTSDRILIEAGTPLIKIYGAEAITRVRALAPAGAYIVADNKCADLAEREVEMMANAGASAATCLGVAPVETINSFIEACEKFKIDSMVDMMNAESALMVLKQLKKLPKVVMLHRGVDESEFSKEKQIPYYQIKQIKGNYKVLVAVAGGDTNKEVQRAIFNGADIVVAWKNFYQAGAQTAELAEAFLKEIK